MGIQNIVSLLGGLGMFLYGMNAMGDGLEKSAGKKLQQIIEVLTSNVIKGVLVGLVVTAIIQSSSATTVMVVGFVNAGVMTLGQAVGVILGANIGTTVTAQILRLSDIQSDAWYMMIFKPDFLAPLAVTLGVGLIMFAKSKKAKDLGQIFAGFGVLFIGMDIMENAVSGIKDMPWIGNAFAAMGEKPLLGVLTGMIVTALIQSSSASIGILQAVANTGLLTFSSAVPIILGQNIGTCITAVLSSIGTTKNAKRTAAVHLSFNIIAVTVTFIAIYTFNSLVGISNWGSQIRSGGIADFHTIFNIINVLLILPFHKILVKIAYLFVPDKGKSSHDEQSLLDERFLQTPAVAISQAMKSMMNMMDTAVDTFRSCTALVFSADKTIASKMEEIEEREELIDVSESEITKYLIKVSEHDLSARENSEVSGVFHTITDIERIGDHALNISEIAENMYNNKIKFSGNAVAELKNMMAAVEEIMNLCIKAYKDDDIEAALKIQPLESVIDVLKRELRQFHINRLSKQECDITSGISFLDIVSNLERISDHCSNIGMAAEQRIRAMTFDPHEYSKNADVKNSEEYRRLADEYMAKYCSFDK